MIDLPKKRISAKKALDLIRPQALKGTKAERLSQLYDQWYGCKKCLLHSFRLDANSGEPLSDIVFGEGNPDAKIMIIGEAPGAEEEGCGVPFVGAAGKLLNQILAATASDVGIQELYKWYNKEARHTPDNQNYFLEKILEWRKSEFFITNMVSCRPPDNRTPTNPEMRACWPRLLDIINVIAPWFIIASGKAAIEGLVKKKVEISKKRGELFEIDVQGLVTTYKVPVMATLHPAYLLRVADYKNKNGSFMQTVRDYLAAMKYVDGLKHRHLGIPIPARPEI